MPFTSFMLYIGLIFYVLIFLYTGNYWEIQTFVSFKETLSICPT